MLLNNNIKIHYILMFGKKNSYNLQQGTGLCTANEYYRNKKVKYTLKIKQLHITKANNGVALSIQNTKYIGRKATLFEVKKY